MSTKVWTEEQFNCPVCLDLPNDPVTIPCGHSYCMECIKDYWVKDDHIGIYSCPQCRQTFCVLNKVSPGYTYLWKDHEELMVCSAP
uniref:RING-type domain-containing protein n=1 Tax=Paramormyrops kingsleyae TaxID=1676925 RepID=A0A3B3SEN0_9TELE